MQETPEQTTNTQPGADQDKVLAMAAHLERERLTGIGGWLIVFVVLMILSVLNQLGSLFMDNLYIPAGFTGLMTLRALISAVLGVIVLGLLFSKKAIFPKLARIYLLLEIALAVIFTILFYGAISAAFAGLGISAATIMLPSLLITVAFCLAWFFYFGKSKRVKYTFTQ